MKLPDTSPSGATGGTTKMVRMHSILLNKFQKTIKIVKTIVILIATITSICAAQQNTQIGLPDGAIARLGKGGINVMLFSPNGKQLAIGTSIGVWLYDVDNGNKTALPTGNVRHFNTLAFSNDGKILASGGIHNTSILLWNTETGSKNISIKLSDRFSRVAAITFTNENTTLIGLGKNRYVTVWDVNSGEELSQNTVSFARSELAISKDGNSFVSGHQEKDNIHLWSTTSGQKGIEFRKKTKTAIPIPPPKLFDENVKKETENGVQAIAYSPDGNTIASAHNNNVVRFWDTKTRSDRAILIRHTEKINTVTFSHDSTMLASGGEDNTIQLWDVEKGKQHGTLTGHKNSIKTLTFSPTENNLLASGSSDGTVRFWNTKTFKEHTILDTGYIESIKTLAFTTDNTLLASAASNGTISMWNMKTGEELPAPTVTNYDKIKTAVFSSDATYFTSNGYDTTVQSDGSGISMSLTPHKETRVWRLPIGEEILTINEDIKSLAISPDNRILVTSNKFETQLYDINSGGEPTQLPVPQFVGAVVVKFSPDGTILATGGAQDEVILWNAITGEKLSVLKEPMVGYASFFAFTQDSNVLAVKYSHSLRFWDLKTKQKRNMSLANQMRRFDELTFSPDGKLILVGSWNFAKGGQIQLWDVIGERKLFTLDAHSGHIDTLVFSHDGKTLASGNRDGTVLLWNWDKILDKIGKDNIGKIDPKLQKKPAKYTNKTEETKAVLNWLNKQEYRIQKLGDKCTITQGIRRKIVMDLGGGSYSLSDVKFNIDRNGKLSIAIHGIGTADFTFDGEGKLTSDFSDENIHPTQTSN